MGIEEGRVENYLKAEVKKLDGFCFKLGGYKGIPDRLVVLPGHPAIFCELKRPNGTLSSAQVIVQRRLKKAGHTAIVLSCMDDVDKLLDDIDGSAESQELLKGE